MPGVGTAAELWLGVERLALSSSSLALDEYRRNDLVHTRTCTGTISHGTESQLPATVLVHIRPYVPASCIIRVSVLFLVTLVVALVLVLVVVRVSHGIDLPLWAEL